MMSCPISFLWIRAHLHTSNIMEGTAYGEANITADYFYLVLDSEWYEGFRKYIL